jgi:SRSO17 transposase
MATPRLPVTPAPAPVERYAAQFDDLFVSRSQRQAFRDVLVGLLRPRDRAKTLTALADVEPGRAGSQHRETQRLHRFLADSPWDHEQVNTRRVQLLTADPHTAPHTGGALLLDDSGDRKRGRHTAHVARQYLGSIGKIDNGIVAVSTAWADPDVYYPLHVVPYTPARRLPKGRGDPGFATKAQLATRLISAALDLRIPFRAVVADGFYGPSESPALVEALTEARLPFVLALKPNQPIATPDEATTTPARAVRQRAWGDPEHPGQWSPVTRAFRDGHTETWWATDVPIGGYRIYGPVRLVVVSTDPATLPKLSTWYLVTNLAHPGLPAAATSPFPPASYAEITGLYGLRGWIEQDYRQVKQELGWADFQVRSDQAIRRHWTLVNCAFSLEWLDHDDPPPNPPPNPPPDTGGPADGPGITGQQPAVSRPRPTHSWPQALRRVRACLAPLHALQRVWRSWTTAPMPYELAELVNALMAGHRLYLYTPP